MISQEQEKKLEETASKILKPRVRRKGIYDGDGYRFYYKSALKGMSQCADGSIALTITSPPYWNAIDYDIHSTSEKETWHRNREYSAFGETLDDYFKNIGKVFKNVLRTTMDGGFCSIVIGTILYKKKHYPIPMMITQILTEMGWEFHQDIIWNKVTGGVKRAGSFIQNPRSGYYYPNIMTEYILIFRKPGDPRRGVKQTLDIDELFKRDIANNVWHIAPVPPRTIEHPCPYPQELVRRLVLLYSQDGDEILDPFLGSGQTALVALKHNRLCVGFDVEEGYLKLAQQRIAQPPPDRKYNLLPKYDKVAA